MSSRSSTDGLEPNGVHHPTILVVDDDEQVSHFLKELLTRDGYQLRFAATGMQALATVQKGPPDVIILDLDMPGMNGVEVYRRLAAAYPKRHSFGVIFLTGAAETPLFDEALDLGIPDVLLKPVNPMQLVLAIKLQLHLLRRRRAKQDLTPRAVQPS
jgi:CheY-like chemotaxis protein